MATAAFLGLTLGVAALVISLSLLAGFQQHIRARLMEETPHLVLWPKGRGEFLQNERILESLWGLEGLRQAAPFVRGRVWATQSGRSAPADLVGREGASGLRVDAPIASNLGLLPGLELTVVSSRTRLSPIGPVPIVLSLPVDQVVPPATGRKKPEIEVPISDARRLMALPDTAASGYEIRLKDPELAPDVAEKIRRLHGQTISVVTWKDANRALVAALKLERIVLFTTVFLIVVVAGLNLAAITAVLAATRAGDAAILSVLGASPSQIALVFLLAGGLIGAAGTLTGVLTGSFLSILLDRFELIPLPARLYSIAHVPFRLEVLEIFAVTVLSMGWSVLAAFWPARAASRVPVSETLRALA